MTPLNASMCACGRILIPPRDRCIICTTATKPIEINNKGKILTYTVLHSPPEGFDIPLILALVELDEVQIKHEHNNPKLVCVGKMRKKDINIGHNVQVIKMDEKYYFKSLDNLD